MAIVQSIDVVMPKKGSSNAEKNSKCSFLFQLLMSIFVFNFLVFEIKKPSRFRRRFRMLFLLNQTWGNVCSVCVRLFQICHNILICSFLQFLFRSKEALCFSSSFSFCPSFFRLCSSEIDLTLQR